MIIIDIALWYVIFIKHGNAHIFTDAVLNRFVYFYLSLKYYNSFHKHLKNCFQMNDKLCPYFIF